MTIVAAMKFSDRVCVLSDTMITDREGTGNNIIPGRLKSIVINEWLTVSYAGLSIQAIDAVRAIYKEVNISTESTIQSLLELSRRYQGDLDFILCSHENTTRLLKIASGQLYEGADLYWIGSTTAATELSRTILPNYHFEDQSDYGSAAESEFKIRFHKFMRENRCEGIGGVIIDCLCSPYGHCYIAHCGAFGWDTIIVGQDDPTARNKKNKTGTYYYEYNVCSTSARGQAIVGFYLNQAAQGFIYDPLNSDDAMIINDRNLREFFKLVDDAGKVLSRGRN